MIIAVDFDGTIVEHRYPQIGRERTFAVATLRQLQREDPDLRLILWTVREGALLQEAIDWCAARGLHFFAVNSNYPGELAPAPEAVSLTEPEGSGSTPLSAAPACRKVVADYYIDDRNLGGLPAWPDIYRLIASQRSTNPRTAGRDTADKSTDTAGRPSLLRRLFGH